MVKFSVLTLFPELFNEFKTSSIIGLAQKNQRITIDTINFRNFSENKHKKVDDYQIGGGPGMVLSLQPIVDAIKEVKTKNSVVILLSPQGKNYSQSMAKKLSNSTKHFILICGHYEGFDQRLENYVDEIISIGDYILTGGEIPAMIIIDSITRLLPKTISKDSLTSETFEKNLLDHDAFAKPITFDGRSVPSVLLSGNHKLISEYRLKNSISKTKQKRPDLYKKYLKLDKETKCQ